MKKIFLSLLIITLLGLSPVYCQFSFGVSPGLGFNSANFGYKMNKIVPSVGFQYFNINMNYEESGKKFDNNIYQIINYDNKNSLAVSAYVPTIGAKYFIAQKNKVQAYFSLNISKPILSGKLKEENVTDEEFNDGIKKVKLWGGELGFGMEYFFDENFSLGGEFGIRYFHLRYKDSYENTIYNPSTGEDESTEITTDYKLSIKPTYTRISLNYYF